MAARRIRAQKNARKRRANSAATTAPAPRAAPSGRPPPRARLFQGPRRARWHRACHPDASDTRSCTFNDDRRQRRPAAAVCAECQGRRPHSRGRRADYEARTVNFTWADDDGEERNTFKIYRTADNIKKHRGLLGARPTVGEFKSAAYAWSKTRRRCSRRTSSGRCGLRSHGNVSSRKRTVLAVVNDARRVLIGPLPRRGTASARRRVAPSPCSTRASARRCTRTSWRRRA